MRVIESMVDIRNRCYIPGTKCVRVALSLRYYLLFEDISIGKLSCGLHSNASLNSRRDVKRVSCLLNELYSDKLKGDQVVVELRFHPQKMKST